MLLTDVHVEAHLLPLQAQWHHAWLATRHTWLHRHLHHCWATPLVHKEGHTSWHTHHLLSWLHLCFPWPWFTLIIGLYSAVGLIIRARSRVDLSRGRERRGLISSAVLLCLAITTLLILSLIHLFVLPAKSWEVLPTHRHLPFVHIESLLLILFILLLRRLLMILFWHVWHSLHSEHGRSKPCLGKGCLKQLRI